jgi:cell division protein FtsL
MQSIDALELPMTTVPDLLKALGELLSTIQSNPMLLLAVIAICAFGVVAMALRVVHAALEKK